MRSASARCSRARIPAAKRDCPLPVSRVDTAARACLLTSTDADARGTWAAMGETAGAGGSNIVVQRYRLPLRGTTYLSQDMVNASVLARLVSRRAV